MRLDNAMDTSTPKDAASELPQMLTRKRLAQLFCCSTKTIYNLERRGILTGYKVGGRVLFDPAEVAKVVKP